MLSVIIPLYNAEKTINRTLQSVKNQTWKGEMEIIVVNDGSTDKSAEVVEDFIKENPQMNIQLLHQVNKGVSSARNAGLRIAKGNFIALLDADDEWFPAKIERQLEIFQKNGDKFVFLATRFNEKKLFFPYNTTAELCSVNFRKLLFRNGMQPSTVVFKREILETIGFFDDPQRYAEDIQYWLRISEKYKMYILNESLVIAGGGKRTFGVSGLSANLEEMAKGAQKNLKDMYNVGRLTYIELLLYRIFYKMKYFLLKFRTFTSL